MQPPAYCGNGYLILNLFGWNILDSLDSIGYTAAMSFVRVGFGVLALRRIASGAVLT